MSDELFAGIDRHETEGVRAVLSLERIRINRFRVNRAASDANALVVQRAQRSSTCGST